MIFGKKKSIMALFILLLQIFLINFMVTSSFGITQSFFPTYNGGDGYIYSDYVYASQPGNFFSNDLKVGCEEGDNMRILLFFDISSLPPNATISNARLFMRLNKSDDSFGSRNISLYWVNQYWNYVNSDANWLCRDISSNSTCAAYWNTPGGDYYSSYVLQTISVGQTQQDYMWQGNLKNAVANWYVQPSENYGLILIGEEGCWVDDTAKWFDSQEKLGGVAPRLEVDYTVTSDTTAPTVTITSPPSGTTYTTAQSVTITATASDNVGVTKVEFYDGATLKGTDTAAPYTYSWSITTADNGAHNWTAKAYDAANNSSISVVTLTVNIDTTCLPPGNFGHSSPVDEIMDQATDVDIVWEDASGATSYDVYFGKTNPPRFVFNTSSTSYDPGTLDKGTIYYWQVVARNSCGTTSGSISSFTTLSSGPSGLTGKAISATKIVISWKDNSADETGFEIQRKSGTCSSTSQWGTIANAGSDTTYDQDGGLSANTTYSYRVRALYQAGDLPWSSWSNCKSAKTALSGTPRAPENLIATSISENEILLTWTDDSTSETSFKIYRIVGTGSPALIATKGANVQSHNDTKASGNAATKTYTYYIQACNSHGCSPSTSWAVVPYQPTNPTATLVSSDTIDIAWNDSTNETGFDIWRSIDHCPISDANSIDRVEDNIPLYRDSGRSPGTDYLYKVGVYKRSPAMPYAYGYSLYSDCSGATTGTQ
jgi:hypothetical protein